MGVTDFWDFVGLRLGSPRSLEGHTTKLNNTQYVTLYNTGVYFKNIQYSLIHLPITIYFLERSTGTLWGIALRSAALTSLTWRVSGFGTASLAYYLPGRPYVTLDFEHYDWLSLLTSSCQFFLTWFCGTRVGLRACCLMPTQGFRVPDSGAS